MKYLCLYAQFDQTCCAWPELDWDYLLLLSVRMGVGVEWVLNRWSTKWVVRVELLEGLGKVDPYAAA